MARQVFAASGFSKSGSTYVEVTAEQVSAREVIAGLRSGSTRIYFGTASLESISASIAVVNFLFTKTSGQSGTGDSGQDLSSAWETGGTVAFAFGSNTLTLDIGGLTTDSSEPYTYVVNDATIAGQIRAFIAALGTSVAGTVAFDDGQASAHAVDAGDAAWDFSAPQPSVDRDQDHEISAAAIAWSFATVEPTVLHQGPKDADAGDAAWNFEVPAAGGQRTGPERAVDAGDAAWSFAVVNPTSGHEAATLSKQFAYRRAESLGETAGLPSGTAEALPAGWSANPPTRTETDGVWRISRTKTERSGSFVRATAWAWDPAFAEQPYLKSLSALGRHVRRFVTHVRHRTTGALASVVWAMYADLRDAQPGRSAISTVFETALIGGNAAADENDEIRALARSTAVSPINAENADTVTRLEIGISAGDGAGAQLRRSFLPQVEAGDVLVIYEDRVSNWVDYLVTAVPVSIAEDARTVVLAVTHLEHGESLNVAGACKLGFSRAAQGEPGVDGRWHEWVHTRTARDETPDNIDISLEAASPAAISKIDDYVPSRQGYLIADDALPASIVQPRTWRARRIYSRVRERWEDSAGNPGGFDPWGEFVEDGRDGAGAIKRPLENDDQYYVYTRSATSLLGTHLAAITDSSDELATSDLPTGVSTAYIGAPQSATAYYAIGEPREVADGTYLHSFSEWAIDPLDVDAPTPRIVGQRSITEDETLALTGVAVGGNYDRLTHEWTVLSGGGSFTGSDTEAPVYQPPDVSTTTNVRIQLKVLAEGDGTNAYADTEAAATATVSFNVRPTSGATSPTLEVTISNKISTLRENATHNFDVDIGGTATGTSTVRWSVLSGGGSINASTGLYDPPNVSSNTAVRVRVTVTRGGITAFDTDTFTVTPTSTGPDAIDAPDVEIDSTSIDEGESQRLTANLSGGNYDQVRSYTWSIISGSAGGSLASTTGRSVTFNAADDVDANVSVRVRVRVVVEGDGTDAPDGDTASASDTDSFNVRDTTPALPDADAPTLGATSAPSIREDAGETGWTQAISGGTYDTLEYSWSITRGGSAGTLSGANTATPSFTPNEVDATTNVRWRLVVTARGTGTTAKAGTSDTAAKTGSFNVSNTN